VEGSENVCSYLTQELKEEVGASWAWEKDPVAAARLMIEHIDEKRAALKLRPMMYEAEEAVAP